MRKAFFGIIIALLSTTTGRGEDWGGTAGNVISETAGTLICYSYSGGIQATPPPCTLPAFLTHTGGGSSVEIGALPSDVSSPSGFFGINGIQGVVPDANSPTGWSYINATIPLSAFARSASVQSLATRVGAVENGLGALAALSAQIGAMSTDLTVLAAYVPAVQQQMEETTWRGAAMAAALDSVGPAAGKRNRLGTNAATVNGETAVAVNYVYAGDTMDVSAGVAYSEGEAISKVGVGISW